MTLFADQLSQHIAQERGLKLWSLIVTILGDLLQKPDDRMPGPVLSALIAAVGLQPQAMRVALHRLKRDGWVESTREGRVGYFRLTEMGRRQTNAVQARVYADAVTPVLRCYLAVLPPNSKDATGGEAEQMVLLSRRAFLTPLGPGGDFDECILAELAVSGLPKWAVDVVAAAACSGAMTGLLDVLAMGEEASKDVIGQTVERILMLHAWRRLVLRANPLAEALMPADAVTAQCRAAVAQGLAIRPRPTIKALQKAVRK